VGIIKVLDLYCFHDFTEVFQGEHNKMKVAVKSLKDQTHDLQKFLAEASVMT